jgi:hypothetical protein
VISQLEENEARLRAAFDAERSAAAAALAEERAAAVAAAEAEARGREELSAHKWELERSTLEEMLAGRDRAVQVGLGGERV